MKVKSKTNITNTTRIIKNNLNASCTVKRTFSTTHPAINKQSSPIQKNKPFYKPSNKTNRK